jgi:hypothetical protein
MVKKRRIHADSVPLKDNRTSLALQLLHRELGGYPQHTATAAAGRPQRDTQQQLLESTLHLIDLQASRRDLSYQLSIEFSVVAAVAAFLVIGV